MRLQGICDQCRDFLRRTDYLGATLLFQRHYEELRQWSPAILKRLLNVARSQHGKLVDVWAPVFAEQTRQKHLIRWRAQLQAPDHRFFAAALMNLADRASILALVRQRNPRRDPKKLVLAWVKELFPSFGAGSLIVLGWLLDGLSWPRIAERVRNAVAPGDFAHQKRNTRALVTRLERSLLSPLMTG